VFGRRCSRGYGVGRFAAGFLAAGDLELAPLETLCGLRIRPARARDDRDVDAQVIGRAFVGAFSWFERTFSLPIVGGLFVLGLTVWILLSVWSSTGEPLVLCDGRGRLWGCAWDPGALYGNAFQNLFQVWVLLATMSIAYAIRNTANSHHVLLHEKLQALRKAVDELSGEDN
jgi:hypothetical protein